LYDGCSGQLAQSFDEDSIESYEFRHDDLEIQITISKMTLAIVKRGFFSRWCAAGFTSRCDENAFRKKITEVGWHTCGQAEFYFLKKTLVGMGMVRFMKCQNLLPNSTTEAVE